jgi:single-strand DNA-binding protein
MLNQVNIIGNLTRDPELRSTPNGNQVTNFSVATTLKAKDKEYTEFHNVVAWGKLAEICAQYLKKGKQVYIGGRLQTREWVDKDEVKRYRTEIIAENMRMLGNKGPVEDGGMTPKDQAVREEKDYGVTEPYPGQKQQDDIQVSDIPF